MHHDGAPYPGFPITIATDSHLFCIGLGDVTGDGVPELIASDNHLGGNYRMHALDLATGMPLPGWPYPLAYWPKGFPTVVDVDNDRVQDVCCATDGGTLLAIAGDGSLIAGSISGVAAGDIDGDGLFELVAATWDGWVYAWDTTGQALPGRADWPMRGINARYTGIFGESDYAASVADTPIAARPLLRILSNPAFQRAEFRIEPGSDWGTNLGARASNALLTLKICDAAGRILDISPVSGDDVTAWRPGGMRPSGVYWARLRGARSADALRFVILR